MDLVSFARMSNVLEQTKQQQVLALGRLGWPVSRIAAAGMWIARPSPAICEPRGCRCAVAGVRAKGRQMPQFRRRCPPTPGKSRNFAARGVHRLGAVPRAPARARASRIASGSRRRSRVGRNAMAIWQDLVDDIGFTARYASVRRFVRQLRRTAPPDARVVIATTPGEDYGESPVMVSPEEARRAMARCPSGRPSHNSYRASNHVRRSFDRRGAFGVVDVGDPARARASRFMPTSICTYTSVDFTSA